MNTKPHWTAGEWSQLKGLISSNLPESHLGFVDWLERNPEIWHDFEEHCLEAIEKDDPHGFR